MNKVTKIVTHPGQAHRDDLLAVSLLLSKFPEASVFRRNPTTEEINDPSVAVVDVGGSFEPGRHNYDHHQFFRAYPPVCAFSLVLEQSGLFVDDLVAPGEADWCTQPGDGETGSYHPEVVIQNTAKELWSWYHTTNAMDVWGPTKTIAQRVAFAAEHSRSSLFSPAVTEAHDPFAEAFKRAFTDGPKLWEDIGLPMVSPVEEFILFWFGNHAELHHDDMLHTLLSLMGGSLINQLKEKKARMRLLDNSVQKMTLKGISTLMVHPEKITGKDRPAFCLEEWIKHSWPNGAKAPQITITADDRGPGLCLFRRNDHPRVDFNRIASQPGVLFVHKNGFVAKIDKGVDPWPLVEAAIE